MNGEDTRRALARLTHDRDEQIRQLSIELAARQRDLMQIHALADEQPTAELLDEIMAIADPDGWADGTTDEAHATDASPDCGWATSSKPESQLDAWLQEGHDECP